MTLTADDIKVLSKPFQRNEHEFTRGFVYITEEAITARLDEVDPGWVFEIQHVAIRDGQGVCHARLTVKGVTRENVGMQSIETNKDGREMGEAEKGATTDALKRCARLFGIGRYLLSAPKENEFNRWLDQKLNNSKIAGSISPSGATFDEQFPPNNTPALHWTADTEAQKKFFQWANKTHGINDYAVLEALDVKAITLYTGSKQDALNAVKAFVDAKQKEAS